MTRPRNVVLLGWLVAIAAGAFSLAALINLGTGRTIGVPPVAVGLSTGYDLAAFQALQEKPTAADLRRARALATKALRQSPYLNSARLRLVQIDVLENGRLTRQGERLFAESYDLLPYDDDVAEWRIRFGLENWHLLSPKSRQAVWREVQTFWTVGARTNRLRDLLASISNPYGRVAAGLWLRVLETKASSNTAHPAAVRE